LRAWHVLTVIAVLFLITTKSSYAVYIATVAVIYAIAALGQALLIGKAGQVALGGAAVMMIGAEVTGALDQTPIGNVFLLPLAGGTLAAAFAGLVVGIPGLRFKGLYLILATLALQAIASYGAQRYETAYAPGGVATDGLRLGSYMISSDKLIIAVMGLFLIAIILFLNRVYRGPSGRILQVISESDEAAAVFGINVRRWKLWAFVTSSAITGLAGGLLVYFLQTASYQSFSLTIAVNLMVMVFLGGSASLAGPILGAVLVTLAPNLVQWVVDLLTSSASSGYLTTNISVIERLIYGLALLVVLLYQPTGIVGLHHSIGGRLGRNRLRRASATIKETEV